MTVFAFIGSRTRRSPQFATANGRGITICTFDAGSGRLVRTGLFEAVADPIWLAADPSRTTLYASAGACEGGALTALRFDAARAALTPLSTVASGGNEACHASLSAMGGFAYIANYGSEDAGEGDIGLSAFPLDAEGAADPAVFTGTHRGHGADATRQRASHPHCILASPDGRWIYVADLGLDLIARYPADAVGHRVDGYAVAARFPPGSGPRHFIVSPDGRFGFAVTELRASIVSFATSPGGDLERLGVLDLSGPPERGVQPAGIVYDPGRGVVFASLRGCDEIVAAKVEAGSGKLDLVGRWPCAGRTPRDIALSPDGGHLLVSNQDSDAVSIFRIERDPVSLVFQSEFHVGTPMVVTFMDV